MTLILVLNSFKMAQKIPERKERTHHPFVSSGTELHVAALTEGDTLRASEAAQATGLTAMNNDRVIPG